MRVGNCFIMNMGFHVFRPKEYRGTEGDCIKIPLPCAVSSVGRAPVLQTGVTGSTPVPPTTVKQASRDDGIGSTPSDSMTNYC